MLRANLPDVISQTFSDLPRPVRKHFSASRQEQDRPIAGMTLPEVPDRVTRGRIEEKERIAKVSPR